MRAFLREYGLAIVSIVAVLCIFGVYNYVSHNNIVGLKFWTRGNDKNDYDGMFSSDLDVSETGQPYFDFAGNGNYVFEPKEIGVTLIDGEEVPKFEPEVLITRDDLLAPVTLRGIVDGSYHGVNLDKVELVVTAYEVRVSDDDLIPKVETDMVHVADKFGVLRYNDDGTPVLEERVGYAYRANAEGVIDKPDYIKETDSRVYGKVFTNGEFDLGGVGNSFNSNKNTKLRVVYRYVDEATGYKAEAMKIFTLKSAPQITTAENLDALYDKFFNISKRVKKGFTEPTGVSNELEDIADYEGSHEEPPAVMKYELDYDDDSDSDKDKKDKDKEDKKKDDEEDSDSEDEDKDDEDEDEGDKDESEEGKDDNVDDGNKDENADDGNSDENPDKNADDNADEESSSNDGSSDKSEESTENNQ